MAPKAGRKRKRAGGGGPDGGSAESLYEELREHQLGSEQKQLLKRSATVGRALTSRERLQDALARRRLGLPPPPDAKERLMHEDEVPTCPPKSARKPDLSHRTPPRSSVQLPASTRQPGWEGSATEASHNTAYTASDPAASINPDLLAEQVMAFDPNNRAHAKLLELQQMAQSKRAGHSGYSKFEARKHESKGERNTSTADRPVFKQFLVRVNRRDDIQNVCKELPIIGMEQEIVETVTYNDISIVCGNTGCGKTTQVPQFLYEAGYGHADAPDPSGAIAVTQPRRVAVTSTARRVADELNLCVGQEVGYQVRYDRQLSDETSLKFMTDGILLREVQEDLLLRKYGVIIVDEAHERSVNTDILLGILSRVVALRRKMADEGALRLDGETVKPLKLIVMSATLRVHDFRGALLSSSALFILYLRYSAELMSCCCLQCAENEKLCPRPPPLIQVPSRQFPVTVHFARRTELHDYASAAYKKVSAIHRKLPKGDILVFLTGKREVENLCKKLQQGFGKRGSEGLQSSATVDDSQSSQHEDESHAMDAFDIDEADAFGDQQDEDLSDSDSGISEDDIEEDEEAKCVQQRLRDTPAVEHSDNEDKSKDDGEDDTQQQHPKRPPWMRAVPLYATLAPSRQAKVFGKHNSDERLVIVATNVAETSLTIPGAFLCK
jgi:ATP-dependent RNA helicase DHX37/DHR1